MPWVELERVGQPVLGNLPALRHISDDLWIVQKIEAQKRAVVRGHRMKHGKGGLPVAVKRGRGTSHSKDQLSPGTGLLLLGSRCLMENQDSSKHCDRRHSKSHSLI